MINRSIDRFFVGLINQIGRETNLDGHREDDKVDTIRDCANGNETIGVNVRYMSTFIGPWYLHCDGINPGSGAWFDTKPLLPTGYIKPRTGWWTTY